MKKEIQTSLLPPGTRGRLRRECGAALVVGLLLLVVMTVIGVATMRGTILEERMASNYRDRELAFQMAEAALRDAELDIRGCTGCTRSTPISGQTGFDTACSNGLCYNVDPVAMLEGGSGVAYGTYTSAGSLPADIAAAPRYVIEAFKYRPPGAASWKYLYRVTALGFGGTTDARVILQSAYKP